MTQITIQSVGANGNVNNASMAPSSTPLLTQSPDYLKPVMAGEILRGTEGNRFHKHLRNYLDDSGIRDSRDLKSTSDIIANAKHAVRQGPPDSTRAGVLKDLAFMFGAITDVGSDKLTDNEKYQTQKEANWAVWRCLDVKRTGVPGLWRAAKQLISEPQPARNFSDNDLRDILVNMLDKMGSWTVPTDRIGAPGSDRKNARQEKSLKRVDEVLERINNPRLQAEVAAKMVSIGKDVPGALNHASAWLTRHCGNHDRKIVFNEALKLIACDRHDVRINALDLVNTHITDAIKNMLSTDRNQLKEALQGEVRSALINKLLGPDANEDEGDPLSILLGNLDATIREINDERDVA